MNIKSTESRLMWSLLNSYPTNSLKQFLEYQSSHCTEQTDHKLKFREPSDEDSHQSSTFEIEIDIGDGRSEVILVNSSTDVSAKANKFCKKFGLSSQVKQLLAESIRQKYQQQKQEAQNKQIRKEIETARQIYSNDHAREVLLTMNDSGPLLFKNDGDQKPLKDSFLKTGQTRIASKVSQSYQTKKYSLGNTVIQDKQNQFSMNKVSQKICDRLGKQNILEYRKKRSMQKKQQVLKQRQAQQQEMMKECQFRPKINGISKKVDRQLLNSKLRQQKKVQRYLSLYQNFKQLQQKKEQQRHNFIEEIPFKPSINPISQKIVQNKRDQSVNQLSHQKQIKNSNHLNCSQDQPFRSLTHTKHKLPNRNVQNLPIGQYLYNKAMRKNKSKANLQSKVQVKAISHSDYLVSILKQKRLNQIFTELTKAPHQLLSSKDINLSKAVFKTGIYRYFQPIFNEMIQFDLALSRSQFVEASLNLFKNLSPEQKHQIIFKKQEVKPVPQLNHSMVNSKSRQILRKSSQQRQDLYTRGINHLKKTKDKVEQNKEEQARQQLKICTFKPLLHPFSQTH